jgi:GT2 family glycosyltransferase
MLDGKKIGVGIVTCNRLNFLKKLVDTIEQCGDIIDHLVVINDGVDKPNWKLPFGIWKDNEENVNVGETKNRAMKFLIEKGCDYIFTLEDDILIKDPKIFENYIKTHLATNLHHFNFGFSQRENLDSNLQPVYRKTIDYGNDIKIVLTKNILGAFTFYTRDALQTIGIHHKDFNNGHGDHLELTYRAYKHGLGTPFWWFADVYGSWDMIENQSNFTTDSVVRNNNFHENFSNARKTFNTLHGCDIFDIPELPESEVIKFLKQCKS